MPDRGEEQLQRSDSQGWQNDSKQQGLCSCWHSPGCSWLSLCKGTLGWCSTFCQPGPHLWICFPVSCPQRALKLRISLPHAQDLVTVIEISHDISLYTVFLSYMPIAACTWVSVNIPGLPCILLSTSLTKVLEVSVRVLAPEGCHGDWLLMGLHTTSCSPWSLSGYWSS